MYLGENNCNLSETKTCSLGQHVSQPFLKMWKFLLAMRKEFISMSNFYYAEILSETISLTIMTSKKKFQNEHLCPHFEYFFSHNKNQEFEVWQYIGNFFFLEIVDFIIGWIYEFWRKEDFISIKRTLKDFSSPSMYLCVYCRISRKTTANKIWLAIFCEQFLVLVKKFSFIDLEF